MDSTENKAQQAFEKMARLCSRSEQCSYDIKKKLLNLELDVGTADEIIGQLVSEKYIDDERYVRAFVKDKFRLNKWGRIKIRYYLKQKGFPDSIIREGLETIDPEKYTRLLIQTMKSKARSIREKDRFKKMGQVIRYAQNRGFEPELIHRYLNEAVK